MDSARRRENRNPGSSSIYPLHPDGCNVVFRVPGGELTVLDRCFVAASSLFVVGAFAWVPLVYTSWAWKKWKATTDKRQRAAFVSLIVATIALLSVGPHRSPRVGRWLKVRQWKLWTSWLKFIAMEVIVDQTSNHKSSSDRKAPMATPTPLKDDPAMLAFVPHGIFPFAFAFGVLPELAQRAFGIFRPVVATATNFFPVVSDFLLWMEKIDASKAAVKRALVQGDRIGIVPGGIAEIFEGYPKPGTHPDEEYSIVRKGFLRLALQHGVPVIPIYCFGATKMFRRLNLPILERLSSWLRASVVVFFGVCGLPIPFRQKLLYVMGNPIHPPLMPHMNETTNVDTMHQEFCNELLRIFDRHKEAYGWGHKSLKLITR